MAWTEFISIYIQVQYLSPLFAKTTSETINKPRSYVSEHFLLESTDRKCFYFVRWRAWRWRSEATDFVGWEQTSVSQCFQLLTVYCGGPDTRGDPQSSCGPADTQTSGTRERQGGLENGSGEVKNGRKADCLDERHRSKLLWTQANQKSHESRPVFVYPSSSTTSALVRKR